MENFTPEIFDIEVDGRGYTIEFNREGLKEADEMGVFSGTKGVTHEQPSIILYAGLKMHKPDVTLNLARKVWESMLEEGYSLKDFNETIADEFFRCFRAFFTESGSGKKKIVARKKIIEMKK